MYKTNGESVPTSEDAFPHSVALMSGSKIKYSLHLVSLAGYLEYLTIENLNLLINNKN
jgi:hypothetical protein